MHDPLGAGLIRLAGEAYPACALIADWTKLANDVFSRAMHRQNGAPFKSFGLSRWRRLERLRVRTKPHLRNAVPMHTLVHAAGDGLYLRQFRHLYIVEGRKSQTGTCALRMGSAEVFP
jgi:hypothetical protein